MVTAADSVCNEQYEYRVSSMQAYVMLLYEEERVGFNSRLVSQSSHSSGTQTEVAQLCMKYHTTPVSMSE